MDDRPQTGEDTSCRLDPIDCVLAHVALCAVSGPDDEVALQLSPELRFHYEQLDTDRWGYLALFEAERALWCLEPAVCVADVEVRHDVVRCTVSPRQLAFFRVERNVIAEVWFVTDVDDWLERNVTTIEHPLSPWRTH